MSAEKYLTPMEIWRLTQITRDRLTYYRKIGKLKKFKKSPGSTEKAGVTMYLLSEVKEVFYCDTT